ncbi:ABC transporter permease, partial [Micrococcus luteus]
AATEAGATTAGGLAAAPTAGRLEAPVEEAGGSARISDADEDGQR